MNTAPVKKRYYFISALLLTFGVVAAVLPEKENSTEVSPRQMLLGYVDDTRFLSTDVIAEAIMNNNPEYLFIDVRTADQYDAFSLPGSINIPVANILDPEWQDYLSSDVHKIVYISNGSVYANQSWSLTQRLGYPNLFVMKGGLNHWAETILMPTEPAENASVSEHELYNTRKGMSNYFKGGNTIVASEKSKTKQKPVVKKKAKAVEEGGC